MAALAACAFVGCTQANETATSTSEAETGVTTTTAPCDPGGRSMTLAGVRLRQFCGPARAEVTIGDETLPLIGGECARHEDWFAVYIGFEVIDVEPGDALLDPDFQSFTLLMGAHPMAASDAAPVSADGAFTEAVLTFAVPNRTYLVADKTVTLVGTRTAGSFTGTAFLADSTDVPLPVEGTFTCDATVIPLEEVPAVVETLER